MADPSVPTSVLAIATGGAVGAISRHMVNLACSRWLGTQFAYGTLAVNIVGCFLLGFLVSVRAVDSSRWNDLTHSALTIGFLGALTTFSAFGFETARFFESSQHGLGLLNIGSNMLLGLMAVYGGLQLGRFLVG